MATTVTLNGQTYSVPAVGAARTWGTSLSNYLIAISTSVLQKSGGAFTLTADANFGTTYGVISAYFKSYAANAAGNIATTGVVRLGNAESIAWRNNANAANVDLKVNASDRLEFDGVAVPTMSSTDTLTNKTLTSPVINTPIGIVKGDIGLGNVDNTSDATKDAATATLTNKTLTKPIVDQIDVTQAASATTPAAGKSALYVSTGDSKLHVVDSSGNDVPVGSGSSGRNYFSDWNDSTKDIGTVTNSLGDTLASSDRTANKTTWGSSNTSLLTIAKSTSSALRESTNYLITEAGSSNGAFIESPLVTLDGVDLGKPVSIRFDVTGNAADGDYQVYICRYDSGDVLQERIVVAGNASTTSPYSAKLPTGTTKFQGFFIASATSTDQYSIRIVSNNNSAASIRIDSLYVGPDTVVQGAAVSDYFLITDITTNLGGTGTLTCRGRQDGDCLELRLLFVSTSDRADGATNVAITLPSRFTIDTDKLNGGYTSSRYGGNIGNATLWDNSAGDLLVQQPYPASSTSISFRREDGLGVLALDAIDNSDNLQMTVLLPIVGWSSNVTMANRAVESYYYTSEAWDAAGSTTAQGAGGQIMSGALTVSRNKVITLANSIQKTDRHSIELSHDGNVWFESSLYAPLTLSSTTTDDTSAGCYLTATSGQTVTITFCRYRFLANDDAPAIAWPATMYWRLRVTAGGASVGFPVSTRNIVGDTSGTTVPSGYIGETITATITAGAVGTSEADITGASLALGAGVWLVCYSLSVYAQTGAVASNASYISTCLTDSSNNHVTNSERLQSSKTVAAVANYAEGCLASNSVLNLSSAATYKLRARRVDAAGTGSAGVYMTSPTHMSSFFAVRIA